MKTTKTYPGDEAFRAHISEAEKHVWVNKLRDAFDAGWEAAVAANGQAIITTTEFEIGDKVIEKIWDDPQMNREGARVAVIRGFPKDGLALLQFPDGSEDTFYTNLLREPTPSEIRTMSSPESADDGRES